MRNRIMKKCMCYTLISALCTGIVQSAVAAESDNTLLVQPDTMAYDEAVPEVIIDEEIAQLSEEPGVWGDGAVSDEDNPAEQEIATELIDELAWEEDTAAEESEQPLTETEIEESEQYSVEQETEGESILSDEDIAAQEEITIEMIEVEGELEEQSLGAGTGGTEVRSGTYGKNMKWTLDSEGVLTISGKGMLKQAEDTDTLDYVLYCKGIKQEDVKKIVVGDGITGIGDGALNSWQNLETVEILEGIVSIGNWALPSCEKLYYKGSVGDWQKIKMGSGRSNPMANAKEMYFNGKLFAGNAFIPDGVTSIGEYAFYGYSNLTSVTLPDTVTSIDGMAFSKCANLTKITIPKSVKSIKWNAFLESGLKKVYGYSGSAAETFAKENGYTFVDTKTGKVKKYNKDSTMVGRQYNIYEKNGSMLTVMYLKFSDQDMVGIGGIGYSTDKSYAGRDSIEYDGKKYYMTVGAGDGSFYHISGSEIEICCSGYAECGKLIIKKNGELVVESSAGMNGDWGDFEKGDIFTLKDSGDNGSKLESILEVPGKLSSFKIQKGKTVKFALTMAKGDTVKSVSSSNAKYVKVASYDKKGNISLKAVKKGKVKVTFTLESGKKRTYTVSVVDAAVKTTGISVSSTKLTLAKGKTKTLKPVLEPFTSTQKVTYVSSNKKVATVSSAGKVKAVGAGKATITVKSGSKSVKVTVTVPGIANVKSSAVVKKGKTLTLQPKSYGISEKITYTSSNKKVATVTSAGKVKGIKKGTATITVKAGKYSAKCKVTVK